MLAHFTMSRTAAGRVDPAGRIGWRGKVTRRHSRVHSAAGNSAGRKIAWGNRGLSAAIQKTIGFRPDGNESRGMAARTP